MPSISNVVAPRAWDFKRVFIALLIAAAIALFFWTQSRIPDLNTKAQMGQRTVVAGLAFDVILPVTADQPVYQRVLYTAVNWGYTNWKGMTFGILFAAAFLVILAYLPRHEFRGQMLNTLKGVVTGVPLGVCVNCTTPIAQGMYHAGVRLETVLATLVSSPTLNVIVLTMSFSLLPFEYAAAKIVGVILFVLLVIPLVSRLGKTSFSAGAKDKIESQLGDSPYRSSVIEPVGGSNPNCDIETASTSHSWVVAFQDVGADFLRALWFVIRTMVPFMLLAGLLGATVIEFVPVNDLVSLPNTLFTALLVAIVGVFLPVPIAFDVVIVSLLISSGVPALFSMTLLFVLGIFSIYPFLILWRNVSASVAIGLFLGATLVGLGCGYGLQSYEKWNTERVIDVYERSGIVESDVQPSSASKSTERPKPVSIMANEIHGRNIAIATRICDQSPHPMAQMFCFDDFMRSEFEKGGGDDFCQSWPGAENQQVREYCLSKLEEQRLFVEASERRDNRVCDSLPPGPKQMQCRETVILARITAGAEIDLCQELRSEQQAYRCLQQGIAIRLDKFNDASNCQLFGDPQDVDNCEANIRVLEYSKGRRPENCEALGNALERDACRRVVAFGMIDDGADASVCDKIPDTVQQQACRAHAATVGAASAGNPELCAVIEQVQEFEVCRRVAVNQQITQEINKATAQQIDLTLPQSMATGMTSDSVESLVTHASLAATPFFRTDGINISQIAYRQTDSIGQGFIRKNSVDYGIGDVWKFSLLEFVSPFMIGRGISAGDFNNDHLSDVVIASNDGVHLFRNTGDGRFAPHPADLAGKLPDDVYVVALVDIDNDGWQDLIASGYGGRVSVVLNDGAGFQNARSFDIDNTGANLTTAAGFADVDLDGDLDVMLGNWSFGEDKSFLENYSANQLLENTPEGFKTLTLDEDQGDSLSVLFSDLNGDGKPDLAIGNDREVPDMYFLGDGSGKLARIRPADDRIPATPLNTMSIESADFNNDLLLDVFSTDMTFSEGPRHDYCDAVSDGPAAERCRMLLTVRERINSRDTTSCEALPSGDDRDACLTAIFRSAVIDSKQPELCEKIPKRLAVHRLYCLNLARDDVRESSFSTAENLPQVQRNVLLMSDPSTGQFRDATKAFGVEASFWTWNAKAADLDNDGWQDIYIGNGFRFGEGAWEIHSNIFFHNQAGTRFEIAQKEFGLEDLNNTPSYVSIDFDFDGDLDILSTGPLSPPRLFINQQSANNAISFALRDQQGNRFGIGSKITIHYEEDGEQRHQLREIKASGGFMSFDAPNAHFGLGPNASISQLEIVWSNGGKTVIDQVFPAGKHYVVTRE